MKKFWYSAPAKQIPLTALQNVALSSKAMQDLKGGDDIIIHDVVDG